jgi:RNA polymerase II-associated factor 1
MSSTKSGPPGLNGSQSQRQKPLAPPSNASHNQKQKKLQQQSTSVVHLPVRKAETHPLYKAKSNFVCHDVKFQCALPNIPLDAKLLAYPLDPQRFVPYRTTTLEKNHKFDLITETDLGIHIDLIDPNTYKIPPNPQLDPEDEALLRDDYDESKLTKPSEIVAAAGTQHKTWLRKTEYMGGLAIDDTSQKAEKVKGFAKHEKPTNVEEELEELERNIEKSFDFARTLDSEFETFKEKKDTSALKRLKHPTKPNLKPVAVYSVFPDEKLWSNAYMQVTFDNDPLFSASTTIQEQQRLRQREGNRLYRGTILKETTSKGDKKLSGNLVNYLLPKNRNTNFVDDTDLQGEGSSSIKEYEYQWLREYVVNVDSGHSGVKKPIGRPHENRYYFLTLDEDTQEANYNQLRDKLNLKKKKAKVRSDQAETEEDTDVQKKHPQYILLKRDFLDSELKYQNNLRDELVPEEALNEEDEDIMRAISKKQ